MMKNDAAKTKSTYLHNDRPRIFTLSMVAGLHLLAAYLLSLAPAREVLKDATVIMATLITQQPKIESNPAELPKPRPMKVAALDVTTIPVSVSVPVAVPFPSPSPTSLTTNVSDVSPTPSSPNVTTAAALPSAQLAASPSQAVVPPKFDADYLDNPAPAYPTLSRRLGEAGKVVLRVLVETNGTASRVEIYASSQIDRLDQAAAEAVKRWRFAPALLGDKPVTAWVLVPVNFSLRG